MALGLLLAACARPAPTPPATEARARGSVIEGRFQADSLGVDKRYRAYLPAGYAESSARFPVIYLLHGLSGNENDWLEAGKLDQAADSLGLRAIVVMPDGDASFYTNSVAPADYDACMRGPAKRFFRRAEAPESFCVRTPRYEDFLTRDLIAHVDSTYRTISTRAGRAIGGLSMGGFGALSIALRHPELYSAAASHSGVVALLYAGPHPYRKDAVQLVTDPSKWGLDVGEIGTLVRGLFGPDLANWRAHDPATLAATLPEGKLALFLDCGTEDDFALQDAAAYLHDVLATAGVTHQLTLIPGRHNFQLWRARIHDSLAFFAAHFQR